MTSARTVAYKIHENDSHIRRHVSPHRKVIVNTDYTLKKQYKVQPSILFTLNRQTFRLTAPTVPYLSRFQVSESNLHLAVKILFSLLIFHFFSLRSFLNQRLLSAFLNRAPFQRIIKQRILISTVSSSVDILAENLPIL